MKVGNWRPDKTLAVGNLDSVRDYTDVRDIVWAYRLLLERPHPRYTTYNICSGAACSGWEVLEEVCAAVRKPIPPTTVTGHRTIDPSTITGNAERLRLETGWEPTIKLRTSIDDFIAFG